MVRGKAKFHFYLVADLLSARISRGAQRTRLVSASGYCAQNEQVSAAND